MGLKSGGAYSDMRLTGYFGPALTVVPIPYQIRLGIGTRRRTGTGQAQSGTIRRGSVRDGGLLISRLKLHGKPSRKHYQTFLCGRSRFVDPDLHWEDRQDLLSSRRKSGTNRYAPDKIGVC
jgi:hypothetical protein